MSGRRDLGWARLKRFPPAARSAPAQTRAILRFAVGKTFRVSSIDKEGRVGLDLSPDADRKFGGFMHEVWVESDEVERDVPRLNEAKGRPAFGDVIHLANGESTFGHLRLLGARKVLGMRDSLTTGPVSTNPTEHTALRKTYWREFYRRIAIRFSSAHSLISAADLSKGLAGRKPGQPVVLWSGSLWAELLFVWWACDALSRHGVSPGDVWLASTAGDFARYATRKPETPSHASDEEVRRIFTFSRRCTATELRSGARLWSAFAAGDLGALQEARTKAASAPPLGPMPASACVMVPQLRRKGRQSRLHLSDYDQRLLGLFTSGEWSTALGRLKNRDTKAGFMSLLEGYGDMIIPVRLAEWASHAPDVLESRPIPGAVTALGAVEYRLTNRGTELLHQGLSQPTEAPPIAIGGFVAYASDMEWACDRRDGEWSFVPG